MKILTELFKAVSTPGKVSNVHNSSTETHFKRQDLQVGSFSVVRLNADVCVY